jgi:hypothetical protein
MENLMMTTMERYGLHPNSMRAAIWGSAFKLKGLVYLVRIAKRKDKLRRTKK